MEMKKSNNMIPNIHSVITMEYGENYWFNGCAKYVMESLKENDYNYGFFAGLTGDNFTQIYYKDHFRGDSATDYLIQTNSGQCIEQVFEQIGYACTYVRNKELKSNREMYLQTLLAYIDKGVPVIRYHWFWTVIVGYEDFGKTLLIMNSDKKEPEKIAFEHIFDLSDATTDREADENGYGWFFVGEKQREVELKQVYRQAVQNILPRLLINTDEYCFGAEAFRTWAADIEGGKFDSMKPEEFDDWTYYTCFICNLATNSGCGRDFLIKAQELNPDLEFLAEVRRLYQRTGEMWNNQGGEDLEALGGGFNITLEALQNKEKQSKIVAKLKEFASTMDKIIALFKENMDENGVLCPKTKDLSECEEIQYYKTVDTTTWKKSPFVPKFSGKKTTLKDKNGEDAKCWYINSLQGKWSTLYSTIDGMKAGETVRLLFWAKFAQGGNHELILWLSQSDWDKHVEIYMNECKPYMLGKKDGYCLFTAIYTALESETVQFSLSANDVIVSIFPAQESDLTLSLDEPIHKVVVRKEISELMHIENEMDELEYFNLPDTRVIGKSIRCPLNKRMKNPIPAFWGKCVEDHTLDTIKAMPKLFPGVVGFTDDYDAKTNTFLYIIGVMCPKDTPVPEGYIYRDIPATVVSKSRYGDWLDQCKPVWEADGYQWSGEKGQFWNAELYLDGENNDGFRLLCAVMKK